MPRKVEMFEYSENGINLTKESESLRLEAYLDSGGVPTIGWGTTVYPDGRRVKLGDKCTVEQAKEWIKHDVSFTVKQVNKLVTVPINQDIFDALVDFAYNVGTGAKGFGGSTLLRLLNAKEYVLASQQFARWKYDNGKVLKGLIIRREKERVLFMRGVDALLSAKPAEPAKIEAKVAEMQEAPKSCRKKKK